MPAYFFNVSDGERENILDQHKKPYDGLRTMGWESKNPQTLYVQDFANDKMGVTINNKGEAKGYTHMKINEQLGIPYTKSPDLTSEFSEGEMCEQCGSGTMMEGMCNECGYKMESLEEMTPQEEDLGDVEDLNPSAEFDYVGGADNATDTYEGLDEDLVESVEGERSTIMEMFQRMRVIK